MGGVVFENHTVFSHLLVIIQRDRILVQPHCACGDTVTSLCKAEKLFQHEGDKFRYSPCWSAYLQCPPVSGNEGRLYLT